MEALEKLRQKLAQRSAKPEALRIAYLDLLLEATENLIVITQGVVTGVGDIKRELGKNDVHLRFAVDLSMAHIDHELADFEKMGVEINSISVLKLPYALTLKLRGLTDEIIDLEKDHSIDISGHDITRLLVTNTAGTGTAKIHVFGKWR